MFPNYYADNYSYNSFYPLIMQQMMNYYQMMNYPQMPFNYGYQNQQITFKGNAPKPNSVITEAKALEPKKNNTSLVGVDVEQGKIDDIKVYETTPEKIAAYKKKVDQNSTKSLFIELGLSAGAAALGAFLIPKLLKNSTNTPDIVRTFLGDTVIENRLLGGLYSALLGAAGGEIYYQTGNKSSLKNIAKECLGEPVNAQTITA